VARPVLRAVAPKFSVGQRFGASRLRSLAPLARRLRGLDPPRALAQNFATIGATAEQS